MIFILYKLYRMKKKGRTSDQKKKRRGKGSCDCYSVQIVQDEKKKTVPAIRRERGGGCRVIFILYGLYRMKNKTDRGKTDCASRYRIGRAGGAVDKNSQARSQAWI